MAGVHNAHKSFESIIFRKVVIFNRVFNHISKLSSRRGSYWDWSRPVVYRGGIGTWGPFNHFGMLLLSQLHTVTFICHCPMIPVAVNAHLNGRWAVSPIMICWWTFRANFIVPRLSTINREIIITRVSPRTNLCHVRLRGLLTLNRYHSRWIAKPMHQYVIFKALISHSYLIAFKFYVIPICELRNFGCFKPLIAASYLEH